MKRSKAFLCAAAFAVICLTVLLVSNRFTEVGAYYLSLPEPKRCELVDASGQSHPFEPGAPENWLFQPGEYIRVVFLLPTAEEMPELYNDGYLAFCPYGAEMDFFVDGDKVFHSSGMDLTGDAGYFTETRLLLDLTWAGRELTAVISSTSPDFDGFHSFFNSTRQEYRAILANGNMYTIPGGFFIMVFILVTAAFLVELAFDMPDWSLIPLALMTGSAAAWNLAYGMGYYFLGDRVTAVAEAPWTFLIPLGFMAVYLFMNFRRSFWQKFGLAVLFSALTLAAVYLILLLLDRERAAVIETYVSMSLHGYPPLAWVLEYLAAICCGITGFDLVKRQLAVRSEARAFSVRQDMLLESYQNMERSVQGTAVMRHEWKNQISSLHLLAEKGDLEGLSRSLSQLDVQLERLSPRQYSRCLTVNVILQNAAARAQEAGVTFTASAPLPEEPGIAEADLCALLINMLDNALHAAAKAAPGKRFVNVSLKINQGFLAVRCENGYAGPLPLDRDGRLAAPTAEGHGYGLPQMRHTAEKYGGILDTSWTDDTFTVQTALSQKA